MSAPNSLLLLAVKRSMAVGSSYLTQSYINIIECKDELQVDDVELQYMDDCFSYLMDECNKKIPNTFQSIQKEIHNSLELSRDFQAYEEGSNNLVFNTIYENGAGKLFLFIYSFTPLSNVKKIRTEYMTVGVDFKLPDVCITLTKMKKRFLRTRSFTEHVFIKPAVKHEDFIFALSLAVSPLLGGTNIRIPTNAAEELKAQAAQVPDTVPSDAPRRTVYNPYKKMNVVITDPTILKLLPGRWITTTSKDVAKYLKRNGNWKFEY